jgi:hypothetical protein
VRTLGAWSVWVSLTLSGDLERRVQTRTCECCGAERQVVTGWVNDDDEAVAAYIASCYPHDGELWLDVILGSWGDETNDDHVTFGCRVGAVEGQPTPACTLVPAASVGPPSPIYGEKLDREQALRHPWLGLFWDIVDLVLTADSTVHAHVYGPASS